MIRSKPYGWGLLASLVWLGTTVTASASDQMVSLDAKINNAARPVTLKLEKGTYEVKPVQGKFAAWSVWSTTNCTRKRGCERTQPTRFTGMHNNYYIASTQLASVTVDKKAIPIVNKMPAERNTSYFLVLPTINAYEVASNIIYPDEQTALASAQVSSFTLANPADVQFALFDNSRVSDNRGGMTLQIHKIEP